MHSPNKAKAIKSTDSLGSDVTGFSFLVLFVLTTLMVNPSAQLWVLMEACGDSAMAVLRFEFPQFI